MQNKLLFLIIPLFLLAGCGGSPFSNPSLLPPLAVGVCPDVQKKAEIPPLKFTAGQFAPQEGHLRALLQALPQNLSSSDLGKSFKTSEYRADDDRFSASWTLRRVGYSDGKCVMRFASNHLMPIADMGHWREGEVDFVGGGISRVVITERSGSPIARASAETEVVTTRN